MFNLMITDNSGIIYDNKYQSTHESSFINLNKGTGPG